MGMLLLVQVLKKAVLPDFPCWTLTSCRSLILLSFALAPSCPHCPNVLRLCAQAGGSCGHSLYPGHPHLRSSMLRSTHVRKMGLG